MKPYTGTQKIHIISFLAHIWSTLETHFTAMNIRFLVIFSPLTQWSVQAFAHLLVIFVAALFSACVLFRIIFTDWLTCCVHKRVQELCEHRIRTGLIFSSMLALININCARPVYILLDDEHHHKTFYSRTHNLLIFEWTSFIHTVGQNRNNNDKD